MVVGREDRGDGFTLVSGGRARMTSVSCMTLQLSSAEIRGGGEDVFCDMDVSSATISWSGHRNAWEADHQEALDCPEVEVMVALASESLEWSTAKFTKHNEECSLDLVEIVGEWRRQ